MIEAFLSGIYSIFLERIPPEKMGSTSMIHDGAAQAEAEWSEASWVLRCGGEML